MKLRQDTETFEATGTPSLATVDTASILLFQSTGGDSIKGHRRLKQVRWDTLDPESTNESSHSIFAQILNWDFQYHVLNNLLHH